MILRPLLGSAVFFAALAAAGTAAGQAPPMPSCEPTDGRTAFRFSGEVAGQHAFVQELPTGWLFWLEPAEHGWVVRVYSNLSGDAPGIDMAQVTPPFHAPNPRELYGWHFRNAGNTGPNLGDVNAPQEFRTFFFSPALIGTGGFRPPDADVAAEPGPDDGTGWLLVADYGLADLDPGGEARMVYLRFEACLTWPVAYDPPPPKRVGFAPEDIERIRACGLDQALEPVPFLQPPLFEIDVDGDGALDLVMPVQRIADGKRALAFCRAGTWLDVIGLDGDLGQLQPAYFDHMDIWYAEPRGPIAQGVGEGPPPFPAGDTITIGIDGASSVKLYWDGAAFRAYWQGD